MTTSVSQTAGRFGVEAVREYLNREGWHYQVFQHKPTFRAVDEALASGVTPHHEAKTVVLRVSGGYVLAVVPASHRVDLHKVRRMLDDPAVRLATEGEIATRFPVFDVGAIPPLGPMVSMPQILDSHLLSYSRIACSAGDHRHAVILIPEEMRERAHPTIADICED